MKRGTHPHGQKPVEDLKSSEAVEDLKSPEAVEDLKSLDSRRLLARIIDWLLLAGAAYILGRALGGSAWTWLVITAWGTVVYFFLCEASSGQTVGKSAVGLRVVRRDGGPPDARSIAARNVIRVLEEPLLALIALVASRRRRQRLGDLAAGTTVGRASSSAAPAPSRLRLAYPAIWTIGAFAFSFSVGPPGSLDDPAPFSDPEAVAAVSYVNELEEVCRAHHRRTRNRTNVPMAVVLRIETDFSHRLGAVEPPPSMRDLHRAIVATRGRVDEVTLWAYQLMRRSRDPDAVYDRRIGPRVRPVVQESFAVLHRAGVHCHAW